MSEDEANEVAPEEARQEDRGNTARGRNYMFTINFQDESQATLLDCDLWRIHVSYCIYQEEIGENGTYHFQGYLECIGKKSMVQLHRLPGLERAWFSVRRGSQADAVRYCSKIDSRVGGPYEWGEMKEQGKRSDLLDVKRKIDEGAKMEQIADEHYGSFIRYHRAFKEYKRIKAVKRDWPMELIFIIGPSGTGKTRTARDMAGDDVYWMMPGKWWEDYEGQHTVVWDEFYGSSVPYSILLRIIDRYPLKLECKGSSICFNSRRIIFTSNQHPKDWYDAEKTHQMSWETNPLNRRIRDFGRVLITGEIHTYRPPTLWSGEEVAVQQPIAVQPRAVQVPKDKEEEDEDYHYPVKMELGSQRIYIDLVSDEE